MKRIAIRIALLTGGIAGILFVSLLWAHHEFSSPGPLTHPVTLVVPRGAGLENITAQLHRAGVIRRGLVFRANVWIRGRHRALQAGEYAFAAGARPMDVYGMLLRGDTVVRRVTFPEGLTTAQLRSRLSAVDGLVGPVPSAREGELLPDTYHFSFGDSRASIVERMRQGMHVALAEAWEKRAPQLPLATPREALILASIIERETGIAAERSRVAGVFVNRLRRGMRLQSDPTVIYALSNGTGQLDRPLSRQDLDIQHPYNTYAIVGLPPGPIVNPGRAAIEAALNPAETEELYFVADGTGGHVFARNLAEHNRNVARWRQLKRGQAPDADAK